MSKVYLNLQADSAADLVAQIKHLAASFGQSVAPAAPVQPAAPKAVPPGPIATPDPTPVPAPQPVQQHVEPEPPVQPVESNAPTADDHKAVLGQVFEAYKSAPEGHPVRQALLDLLPQFGISKFSELPVEKTFEFKTALEAAIAANQ